MPAYKDKNNGRWYCKFYYTDWMGERRQKWKRGFKTKKEAKKFESDFLQRQRADPQMTFENLYIIYMEEMETRLKKSTLQVKKNIYETKILPFFAKKPISEITPTDVRQWQNIMMDEGNHYSETYLKTINNQLTAIINYARRYYNLSTNPCEQAGTIGTCRAQEMNCWTLDEYMRFREGARHRIEAYTCFEVLYWTGVREGEMLALTKPDIDLDDRLIHIDKTFQRIHGADIITTPKTKKSIRKVPIPDFLCLELKDYMKSLGEIGDEDRVFPYSRTFLSYEMKKCSAATGVKKIRIHDIRHSHVSLLINQGFDALLIADRVGHERVSTTLNTYAHLFPHKQEKLVATLEQLEATSIVAK